MKLETVKRTLEANGYIWQHDALAADPKATNGENSARFNTVSLWFDDMIRNRVYQRSLVLWPNIDKGTQYMNLIHVPSFNMSVLKVPQNKKV